MLKKQEKKQRRHKKIRAKISGTALRPRLHVFRSAKHIYAQLIDDEKKKTLVAANDLGLKKSIPKVASGRQGKKIKDGEKETITGKVAVAFEVGKLLAEKALDKKIEKAVFDRGGYRYHSRVKALAEGAREKGLKF